MKCRVAPFLLVFLWSTTMAAKKETQYTNIWIAEIHGGEEVAKRVARDLGYTYQSPAEPFEDHYIFLRDDHPEVSTRYRQNLTRSLLDIDEVKWAEQQAIVERSKRGFVPVMKNQEYHERVIQGEADKLLTVLDGSSNSGNFKRGIGTRNNGYDNSGYGNSGYGNSGYGNSGYGHSGYGHSGYGNSGYGNSGYESSGYGSSGVKSQTSDNTVYVTVSSSDTVETIVNNVLSQVGSNNVGALIICNEAISSSIANKLNYQLARSGKVVGGLSVGTLSGSVSSSYIENMVTQLQSSGQIDSGSIAVVFKKDSGDARSGAASQGVQAAADNVATNEQGSDGNVVYVSVGPADSGSSILSSVIDALGSKNIGLLIVSGNPLSNTATNNLLQGLYTKGKVGGGGVGSTRISSSGGTAGKRTINTLVKHYTSAGMVGGENVAVVVSEGRGNSNSGSGSSNQDVTASNTGTSNSKSGSSNQDVTASKADTSNSASADYYGDLYASAGLASGGDSNPSTSTKPSTETKPSSGSSDGGDTVSQTPTSTTGGSTTNNKVIVVKVDKVSSVVDYITEQLGDSKVCAMILSGNNLGGQSFVSDLYEKLSMEDKVIDTNMSIMQISEHDGSPANARGVFNSVSDLIRKGKVGTNEKVVVLTTGDNFDMAALNEMMEEGDQGDLSKLGTFPTQPTDGKKMISTYGGPTKHIGCLSSKESAYKDKFNDPLWPKQWYAQDYRTTNVPVMDLNIVPVYKMGYTGEGVYVAVVDDGVQHNHPDLTGNFVESLSYDMCVDKPGSEPAPPDSNGDNSHGTKCAGVIAMVANNEVCGVGVAYNAKVAGVRTLGPRTIEYSEAKGLVHKLDTFHIYSSSWGPNDDGKTLGQVGHMTLESFDKAMKNGRGGKGTIYVFSAGNGKRDGDNCALDGIINHMITIPIAGVSQRGKTVYYSERCTAVFAASYSGGNQNDEAVASTDINNGCTTSFSGTSAAAPVATGIIALVLQANPDLTYRDVMHLITMSAEVAPLANNENIWYKNGRGFWVSNDFGFGLMNAENMVRLAKSWKTVPKRKTCIVAVNLESPKVFTVDEDALVTFDTEACQNKNKDQVYYLEQIELSSTIQYPYRGAISMKITSPSGTVSDILEPRLKDDNTDGLNEWSILSVHNWGEDPKGKWKIVVKANPIPEVTSSTGYVNGFTLLLHGTMDKPAHYDKPRKYAGFRLPNGKTSEV